MTLGKLTERQEEILEWIVGHFRETLCFPTFRELGSHFGAISTNAVFDHITALHRKGYLCKTGGKAWTFTGEARDLYGLYFEEKEERDG